MTPDQPLLAVGKRMTEDDLKKAIADAKAQSALESAINSLSAEVKRLTITVEKNNEKLERLSSLEASHTTTNEALERAFTAIEDLENEVKTVIETNNKEHKNYDKYLWLSMGFATAISVIWSVVGYRMNAMIDRTIESVIRMEQHITTDRMMNETDVRAVIEGRKP